MRVLITGSEGFIGQNLRRELQDAGHVVFGMDIVTSEDDDASSHDSISRAIEVADSEVVVHLAHKTGEDEIDGLSSDLAMTAVVAQACGESGARLVYASSGGIYGDNGAAVCDELKGPFKQPSTVQGLGKRFGESVGQFYAPNGFTALRFSSVYGPGLPLGRSAVVDFLATASSGKKINAHISAERSWCWVGDAVRAVRLAIEHGEGPFNIARDDDTRTMKHVAELACGLTGADKGLVVMVPAPERQAPVKRVGTSRIRSLGWAPRVSLYDGMTLTLARIGELDESSTAAVEVGR